MSDDPSTMDRRRFGQGIAAGIAGLWGLIPDTAEGRVDESVLPSSIDCVDTVASMQQVEPSDEQLLYVRGYHRAGDGGGGLFAWAKGSDRDQDGGVVFASEVDPFRAGQAREGRWIRQWEGDRVSVRWFGARGNLAWTDAATVTQGSPRVRSQEAVFQARDVGKGFVMNGREGQVVADIERYVDPTTVILDREVQETLDGRFASWGVDDAPAFNRAIAFANPDPVKGGELQVHNEVPSYGVFVPDGDYLIESPIILREGVMLEGSSVFGSRLNISFAREGGDHRIRSYFHDNLSGRDTGSYPHLQKNFGMDHLGIRPRPAERNPGGDQAFIHIRFGIEFYLKHSYLSQSNSYGGGAPWNTIGLLVEKNVDLHVHDTVFEGGRYGMIAREPKSGDSQELFSLRGGRISDSYFYNHKRCSCLLYGAFNSHLSDCVFKYAQAFNEPDRTALVIDDGRTNATHDLAISDVYVNGYRADTRLQRGMHVSGRHHQVTGLTVKTVEQDGILIDGTEVTVSGFSVSETKGDAVRTTETAANAVLTGGSVTNCAGAAARLAASGVVVGLSGDREEGEWVVGADAVVVDRDGIALPGGWERGRLRIGDQYLWEEGQTLRMASGQPSSPQSGRPVEGAAGGPSAERPVNPDPGTTYFDQDLGQPLWWSGQAWVDAQGRVVR